MFQWPLYVLTVFICMFTNILPVRMYVFACMFPGPFDKTSFLFLTNIDMQGGSVDLKPRRVDVSKARNGSALVICTRIKTGGSY